MSNNNITDPNEQNQQLLARLWDATKRRLMGNVIVYVVNPGDLRREEY